MRVFISWSGSRSKAVATALHVWLPNVLQAVKPYLSTEIEKGARWALSIGEELESAAYGILVVTPGHREAPWLLYEAGALSKKLGDKVTPFLVDMKPSDLTGPLTAFQATEPTLPDVTRLVRDINTSGNLGVAPERLPAIVERWWPDLDKQIQGVVNDTTRRSSRPRRGEESMLEEVLATVRSMSRQLSMPRRRRVLNPGDTVTFRDDDERLITMSIDRDTATLLNSGFGFERADVEPSGTARLAFQGIVNDENLETITRLAERGEAQRIDDDEAPPEA